MDQDFVPLDITVLNIGIIFKSSKRQFNWRFRLNGTETSVKFECSLLTNKRRVYLDGRLRFDGNKPFRKEFHCSLTYNGNRLDIQNTGHEADLSINSQSFNRVHYQGIWNRMYEAPVSAESVFEATRESQRQQLLQLKQKLLEKNFLEYELESDIKPALPMDSLDLVEHNETPYELPRRSLTPDPSLIDLIG